MKNKKTYTLSDILQEMVEFSKTEEFQKTDTLLISFLLYLRNKEKQEKGDHAK